MNRNHPMFNLPLHDAVAQLTVEEIKEVFKDSWPGVLKYVLTVKARQA